LPVASRFLHSHAEISAGYRQSGYFCILPQVSSVLQGPGTLWDNGVMKGGWNWGQTNLCSV
jgi:hypothetical protein